MSEAHPDNPNTSGFMAEFSMTTHAANREVIARMAEVEGWTVETKPSEVEGWDYTDLQKSRSAPERSNPHGLRVV